ncbi:hypothetical protein [Methanoculleus chikugoensis]|uniref:thiamine-phosphate synthase family protein n=1 Tax=Methanoculleus chikugoensis TaxID=118126 RepID=UPI001FB2AC03|nr:thiamine-phosphate synthase family protein [Methanoculleus chikugoensis]
MMQEEREKVVDRLEEAVALLVERMDARLIPEVGMNIGYALPDARSKDDVAGVLGRIVRLGEAVHPPRREIAFGGKRPRGPDRHYGHAFRPAHPERREHPFLGSNPPGAR